MIDIGESLKLWWQLHKFESYWGGVQSLNRKLLNFQRNSVTISLRDYVGIKYNKGLQNND